MGKNELQLTLDSLKTELVSYKDKPLDCLYEYIWNSFDAGAKTVNINFELPKSGMGSIESLTIEDDGLGWDFRKEQNTKTFLSSSKRMEANKNKTLPRGKYGRGRYVFIWIAEKLEILSAGQKLILTHDTNVIPQNSDSAPKVGTKVSFVELQPNFSSLFFNEEKLVRELILEFCWFLRENPAFSIKLNDKNIDAQLNVKENKFLKKDDFNE